MTASALIIGTLLCAQLDADLACNRFAIEFLAGQPPGLRNGLAACALHGPEASSELAMLAVLHSPALRSLPLLPALLRPPPAVAAGDGKHAIRCNLMLCTKCGARRIRMKTQVHAGSNLRSDLYLRALVHAALHAHLPVYHLLDVKGMLQVCSDVNIS